MSELKDSIIRSILSFDFGDYGFDFVEITKEDTGTNEWVYDLAHKIDKDYGDYVESI